MKNEEEEGRDKEKDKTSITGDKRLRMPKGGGRGGLEKVEKEVGKGTGWKRKS